MAAPPGRHCPGRVLLRLPLHRRAAGRCRCVSIIAGPSVIRKLARHMTFASIPSLISDRYLRSCTGLLRRRAAAACWRSAWCKTHATNSLLHIRLASFCHECRYFSSLHEGLALCFVRHVSAHHSMLPFVCRLMGNSTCGGSMFIVAACSMCFPLGLLLSCSCSTSLDSAFLQRRAALPIIEAQKPPWNVSDVDRFVSRKNKDVTVWIVKFFQKKKS